MTDGRGGEAKGKGGSPNHWQNLPGNKVLTPRPISTMVAWPGIWSEHLNRLGSGEGDTGTSDLNIKTVGRNAGSKLWP